MSELDFTLSLIDNITKPIRQVQSAVSNFARDIALLAYGIYKLIKHWDAVKAAVMNTTAFKVVAIAVRMVGLVAAQAWEWMAQKWQEFKDYFGDTLVFKTIIAMSELISQAFNTAWNAIADGWAALWGAFENFSLIDTFDSMIEGVVKLFFDAWETIESSFAKTFNGIIDLLNYLPGVNIETKTTGTVDGSPAPAGAAGLLVGGQLSGVEKGGISRQISNNRTQSIDNSKRYDTVNINVTNGMSPTDLAEWTALDNG